MGILKEVKMRLRRQLSSLRRDRPALLTFLFHALYRDDDEIAQGHTDPQQRITIEKMRVFVEYFLEAGYHFVAPSALNAKLDPAGNYIMISFDDGYYNNWQMLPIMQEYEVPAVFFITTGNLQRNECFWWDVSYRERHRQGWDKERISAEQKMLKSRHHREILRYLKEQFGKNCLTPWSDTDRPMTPAELRAFSRQPGVSIGNHTADHYLLDRYPREEVRRQIQEGQQGLRQLLGRPAEIIAYPNGSYSDLAITEARACGLRLGLTVDKRKNPLPLDWGSDAALALGRFVLWGDRSIPQQCDIFRSDLGL